MATHQHATLEDTVYVWFGSNKTDGDGDDGASPVWAVRLAGAAAGAAAVDTGVPTLLTHGDFTAGAHEVAVAATDGNGFAAGNTYAVFVSLLVSSVNPTGFAGSFTLAPIIANTVEVSGTTQTANDNGADINAILEDTGTTLENRQVAILADVTGINGDAMRGTDDAALADKLLAYIQLTLREDAAIAIDRSTELAEINQDEDSGAGNYANTTASQFKIAGDVSVIPTLTLDAEVDNDGTAISLRGAQKLMLSILTGVSSGGGSATITFKKLIDGTTTRISATVDANGNRTAVGTRDAT
jgi:hypothetical protein